jgi:hypothetical protein
VANNFIQPDMARLFRLAIPMTLLICLGPVPSEAVTQSDSQQEWISRSSQSRRSPKNKKPNKKHHHHAAAARPLTAFNVSTELQLEQIEI